VSRVINIALVCRRHYRDAICVASPHANQWLAVSSAQLNFLSQLNRWIANHTLQEEVFSNFIFWGIPLEIERVFFILSFVSFSCSPLSIVFNHLLENLLRQNSWAHSVYSSAEDCSEKSFGIVIKSHHL